MTIFDRYKYDLKIHLKNNFWVYFLIAFIMIVGVIFGFILAFSGNDYVDLLSSTDKNLFEYINGSAELSSIFFSRLLSLLLFMFIIFVTSLSVYTTTISIIIMGYQCLLLVLSCFAVIDLYGISGVINSLLLIIPINLINLLVMAFFCGTCVSRVMVAHKFKMKFGDSCKYINFYSPVVFSIIVTFVICLISSVILPLIIKSFILVSF